MNLQEIEQLINKYEQGETTLEEEEILKSYFEGEHIPQHLSVYKELFGFYETASQEELPNPDFDKELFAKIGLKNAHQTNTRFTRRMYPYIGIAASILLLISIYFIADYRSADMGTYDDPQIAFDETKKILMTVSGNLNTGMSELSNVQELNTGKKEFKNIKTFDDGLKKLGKISILDKSKQMITQ